MRVSCRVLPCILAFIIALPALAGQSAWTILRQTEEVYRRATEVRLSVQGTLRLEEAGGTTETTFSSDIWCKKPNLLRYQTRSKGSTDMILVCDGTNCWMENLNPNSKLVLSVPFAELPGKEEALLSTAFFKAAHEAYGSLYNFTALPLFLQKDIPALPPGTRKLEAPDPSFPPDALCLELSARGDLPTLTLWIDPHTFQILADRVVANRPGGGRLTLTQRYTRMELGGMGTFRYTYSTPRGMTVLKVSNEAALLYYNYFAYARDKGPAPLQDVPNWNPGINPPPRPLTLLASGISMARVPITDGEIEWFRGQVGNYAAPAMAPLRQALQRFTRGQEMADENGNYRARVTTDGQHELILIGKQGEITLNLDPTAISTQFLLLEGHSLATLPEGAVPVVVLGYGQPLKYSERAANLDAVAPRGLLARQLRVYQWSMANRPRDAMPAYTSLYLYIRSAAPPAGVPISNLLPVLW
ncbi:MAG: LolA family protein [Armatimonadota bacterium]